LGYLSTLLLPPEEEEGVLGVPLNPNHELNTAAAPRQESRDAPQESRDAPLHPSPAATAPAHTLPPPTPQPLASAEGEGYYHASGDVFEKVMQYMAGLWVGEYGSHGETT